MKSLMRMMTQFVYRLRHGITLSNTRHERLVESVATAAEGLSECDDEQLKSRFAEFRTRVSGGHTTLDEIAADVFAVAQEAADRTVGMRPYDVQLLAAFAMHDGKCVEMQTGEGKTLAAAITVCLRALSGHGVHVLTFNDYLAGRDAAWMGPLYDFLGFTVGHVDQEMSRDQRRAAYQCDITYVTAKEAGFDFLRDCSCEYDDTPVQQTHSFAIVDEADSILIDEARIPLVIATVDERDDTDLTAVAETIRQLHHGRDYQIKQSGRNISFTDAGLSKLEQQLGCGELHSEQNIGLLTRLNLALQAEVLLSDDVDYIVRNDRLELIDEFTGRVAADRKWPGGLQAALEAKEGVPIQPQGRILNSISLQHFIELYDELSGMTGTAVEATEELQEFYRLKVVIVPANKPCVRVDHDDRVFATKQAKHAALVTEISDQHRTGRPVLIGTASVDESELLANQLRQHNIDCRVLNAANDHLEAEIISEAGAWKAVTISTNMAGRGTDIRLGGSAPEHRQQVLELGGLYVIGTNRHESRRIDNQLRGRSGRQGDPGESRFFVSLEDDLIARHGIAELISLILKDAKSVIDDATTAQRIGHVQRIIEGESIEIRRTLRMYTFLLELQRRTIQKHREDLLTLQKTPAALRKLAPEFRDNLIAQWGQDVVIDSERKVTLIHIDWSWSDHLAHAAEIREGIHFVSLGGFNAFDTFNREMNLEFQTFVNHVEEQVVTTMKTAEFTSEGIDFEKEGLSGPSSTWTFMINDNPRGAVLNQIIRGVVDRVKRAFPG